ncbi:MULTISPECIES: inorganic phosphate transporter [Brucella/Ochrobactrum group]|jgi:PiT family inorganic phosphate transporter|uniref:Phosphate transporter n=1 Tax=Brucella pseudintermedia TaxID=370111 RepID=A0ABY5UEY7_9HYPH|nr:MULTISPECIES: inorganic phosphate transporter [Brucella/Ochrobactrum group]KAB2677444.1 inorganic phosphate transporter [Brucella pseudintermedia]MCO7728442.1 inorganic phosphate transporter [Brucella intermedia]NKE74501.1 inorganic phosphate transporter [Ochrobactrum sp. MC-1LL]TWH02784.1 PiT family inorganic phosphate transporter [Ochrobactrum sp. J50]UWL61915.1 inorganic phosphate transporter [Brucella pseudintermedia]
MANEDLEARHLETLDRDLGRFAKLETAASYVSRPLVAPGIALVFIMLAGLGAAMLLGHSSQMLIVVAAAVFGAYMALNIGANDVANNMGPAVGANALSMGGAIAIAAVFESAGALIAGADVVSTVATGIIAPDTLATPVMFIWAMMAALLASALWVNLATWIGAPVSTTHAVVGGVVGAGIVAAGFGAVNWSQMAAIAASWVISPVLGAIIAAGFLWLIKARIVYRADKIAAARVWVPILVGVMAGTFATYLIMKGLKQLVDISIEVALMIGVAFGLASWLTLIPVIRRQSQGLENRNKSLKVLFSIPLVVSAALLSFAHGANDVANAVGPLAAIVQTSQTGALNEGVEIPLWVMLIGACGISFGLCLFGPKLIRMVGNQITKLNPMRAYCVSLSAAITVILASWLGLPVSSTHIAIGAIFGVGFFREWDTERRLKKARQALPPESIPVEERRRRKLVRRSHALTIAAAWVVTVPAAAILSAILFALLNQLPVGNS